MDRASRPLLVALGASYLAMATQLSPPYFLADLISGAPFFYEVLFTAAGLSCMATAVWPQTVWPYISGGLVMASAASRSVVVLFEAAGTPEVSLVPVIGWLMILILQIYVWPYLAPKPPRLNRR